MVIYNLQVNNLDFLFRTLRSNISPDELDMYYFNQVFRNSSHYLVRHVTSKAGSMSKNGKIVEIAGYGKEPVNMKKYHIEVLSIELQKTVENNPLCE